MRITYKEYLINRIDEVADMANSYRNTNPDKFAFYKELHDKLVNQLIDMDEETSKEEVEV